MNEVDSVMNLHWSLLSLLVSLLCNGGFGLIVAGETLCKITGVLVRTVE